MSKLKPKDYTECDCSICVRPCVHKDSYRRLPAEIGGLELCKNLSRKYKLRVYKLTGSDKGNLDHEEFFDTIEEMVKRYDELFRQELYSLNSTAWKKTENEWVRILEADIPF